MRKRKTTIESRTLKARWVFPVDGKPLPGGLVEIHGQRIVEVGSDSGRSDVEDLGNVAILPGLVNAHTHLEFSNLSKPLGEPGMDFVDWIRRVVAFRRQTADTSHEAIGRGLRECIGSGTTSLGEIAQPGWPVEQFEYADIEVTVFLEVIAPRVERVAPAMEVAQHHFDLAETARRWRPGFSPHAPYSIHPELLAVAVALLTAEKAPIAFHLAESREELELLHSGSGPFRDLLDELDAWDPTAIRPGTRPLDYLRMLESAHRTLIVHGNYLDDVEIEFLADHADRMAVVYCPRTHQWFDHRPYPLAKLLSAGATVALGTDSRASSPDLSILAELRFVAERYPGIGRDVVLKLGTINAARALDRDGELGSLKPGKYADLTIVGLPDRDAADPHDLLFNSNEPVLQTWFRGVPVDKDYKAATGGRAWC